MGETFEWDEAKAAANYAKHGVSFETSTKSFKDASAIERLDDRGDYGEDRYILTGTAESVVLVVVTPREAVISGLSRRAARPSMSQKTTSSKMTDRPLRSMTPEEVEAAAYSDPDNRPLSPADLVLMKRTPQVKVIRRAIGISQEEFAARFHIPIGTLRDWEQGCVALQDLKSKTPAELVAFAEENGVENASTMRLAFFFIRHLPRQDRVDIRCAALVGADARNRSRY